MIFVIDYTYNMCNRLNENNYMIRYVKNISNSLTDINYFRGNSEFKK